MAPSLQANAAPSGTTAAGTTQALAAYDARPYFARALDHGIKNGIIEPERLDPMRIDGAKGWITNAALAMDPT